MTSSRHLHVAQSLLLATSAALILLALYHTFIVVPNERTMGAVYRIFYFHVSSAIACYVAFGIVFIASLAYLGLREERFDVLNLAAAEVGFMLCTITLASGMIWGHAAWNTWFSWEPRLVTFLLLWLIFLSFIVMRNFGDTRKLAAHSAVLGIVGALTVPVVWLSVQFLPQTAQLHPRVVDTGGLKDPSFTRAFLIATGAMIIFQFTLVALRTRIGLLEQRIDDA